WSVDGPADPRANKRPSPPGEGPGFRRVAVVSGLPPSASRLPPGAGNQGKKPKYEELELGKEGTVGKVTQTNGHAAAVSADGNGGEAAGSRGLLHVGDTTPLLGRAGLYIGCPEPVHSVPWCATVYADGPGCGSVRLGGVAVRAPAYDAATWNPPLRLSS